MNSHALATWEAVLPGLSKFVYSRVRHKDLAEDFLQDAFIKYQRNLETIQATEKAKSWIYRVTHNLIVDHYRKKKSAPEGWEDTPQPEPNFNDCVTHHIRKFIHTLPDKYREAVQLSELGSMSQVQLAEHLGISFSGAKSRVQRARMLLRQRLEEHMHLQSDLYGNIIECVCKESC